MRVEKWGEGGVGVDEVLFWCSEGGDCRIWNFVEDAGVFRTERCIVGKDGSAVGVFESEDGGLDVCIGRGKVIYGYSIPVAYERVLVRESDWNVEIEELGEEEEVNGLCGFGDGLWSGVDDAGGVFLVHGPSQTLLRSTPHTTIVSSCTALTPSPTLPHSFLSCGLDNVARLWNIGAEEDEGGDGEGEEEEEEEGDDGEVGIKCVGMRDVGKMEGAWVEGEGKSAIDRMMGGVGVNPPMVHTASFHQSTKLVAAAIGDGTVAVWDTAMFPLESMALLPEVLRLRGPVSSPLHAITWLTNSTNTKSWVVAGGSGAALLLWDLTDLTIPSSPSSPPQPSSTLTPTPSHSPDVLARIRSKPAAERLVAVLPIGRKIDTLCASPKQNGTLLIGTTHETLQFTNIFSLHPTPSTSDLTA